MAGIGGGSVLDVTKLVAAFIDSDQQVEDCFGMGFIRRKGLWFACLPTTAGTGSEVSPNAILLDERDHLKKGIVSPFLIADVAYVDPKLTWTVPAKVTADTGMDALTHCIEAYTNKFAHPSVDIYALQGIRLIAANLERAVTLARDNKPADLSDNPAYVEAREALAFGSLYGGLCLGPVNTAAVHALSYPLGGEFHIPHGLSNAILLPSVMKFNMPANIKRHAEVAIALGCEPGKNDEETAQRGVDFIYRLAAAVGIPDKLTALGIRRRYGQSRHAGAAPAEKQPSRGHRAGRPRHLQLTLLIMSHMLPCHSSPKNKEDMKPILAITMGDPAGIGPEITVRALNRKETYEKCRPVVTGDAAIIGQAVRLLGLNLQVNAIQNVKEAKFEFGTIDVIDLQCVDLATFEFGKVQPQCGNAAFQYIKKAIELAMADEVDGTVTAPLNKEALNLAGHHYDGHTEIYATFTNTKKYAMMLAEVRHDAGRREHPRHPCFDACSPAQGLRPGEEGPCHRVRRTHRRCLPPVRY